MENNLPKRKRLRLENFDYSTHGAYFVTICTKDRTRILSEIVKSDSVGDAAACRKVRTSDVPQSATHKQTTYQPVGDVGARRKARTSDVPQSATHKQTTHQPVGDGALDVPQIQLTSIGKIVEKHLLSSEKISGVKIDRYVLMPNHIHVIIFLDENKYVKRQNGTSKAPSPTNEMLPHIVSTFKRFCHKEIGENIFQRAFYEHIIRDREDYETRVKYIRENPAQWYYDELYAPQ